MIRQIFIKRILLFLSAFLLTSVLYAQDEPQVLISNSIDNISGFGGFLMDFSSIDHDLSVSTGGGGAVLLNQVFYFGGYGLGNLNRRTLDNPAGGTQSLNFRFNHGGFWLGYIIKPNKLIHYNVSTKFGWGDIELNNPEFPNENILNDNIFAVTPQVEAEVNISYWFRINASLGYRLVGGVDNDWFKSGEFSSPAVGIGFLFGWFKKY